MKPREIKGKIYKTFFEFYIYIYIYIYIYGDGFVPNVINYLFLIFKLFSMCLMNCYDVLFMLE